MLVGKAEKPLVQLVGMDKGRPSQRLKLLVEAVGLVVLGRGVAVDRVAELGGVLQQ